jgi:hypothetical protein
MPESSPSRPLRPDLLAGLACATIGLILAVDPHLAMLWRHGTSTFIADHDDALYLSIARALYYGEGAIRDPYLAPTRGVPSLYSWAQFAPTTLLARHLGIPFLALGLIWRIVGGAALGTSLYLLIRRVMGSSANPVAWSLGLAIVCLADPGFITGRTLFGEVGLIRHMLAGTTPMTKPDAIPQYRVVTPLLNLPAFLLLLAVVVAPPRRRRWGIVIGAILLALCIYLYFFLWTAAVLALGLYAAANLVLARFGPHENRELRRQAGRFSSAVLTLGLFLGAPMIYGTATSGSDPTLKPALERISKGYHAPPGHPLRIRYLRNTWTWAKLALGAFGLLKLRVRRTGLLLCVTLVGYAMTNSALLTGLEFENYHWAYAYVSVAEVLTLTTLGQWLDRLNGNCRRWLAWLWIIPAGMLAISLTWRFYEALKAPEAVAEFRILRELEPLRSTLSELGPECVIAGEPAAVQTALLDSRCSLLYHDIHSQVVSPIPDREVHERDALDGWLRGLDLATYEQQLSTLTRFGYVEPDDPRWPLDEIRRERVALFRSLLEGDSTLLKRYPPNYLLLRTSDGHPSRGGPWKRLDGDERWTLWERVAAGAS